MDTARDWSMGSKLSLHLLNTTKCIVFAGIVLSIFDSDTVLEELLTWVWWWTMAVTANIDVSALVVLVQSDVVHAGRVHDTSLVSVIVNESWITSIARATDLAVDDSLWVKTDWGWGRESVHDVESISKS